MKGIKDSSNENIILTFFHIVLAKIKFFSLSDLFFIGNTLFTFKILKNTFFLQKLQFLNKNWSFYKHAIEVR